jgi:hypothetical protein
MGVHRPFTLLKDAHAVPPEAELMMQRVPLGTQIAGGIDPREAERRRERLSAMEPSISLRLKSLGTNR